MELTPDEFPVTITIPVQWGDQDDLGHVNNVHYLRWFESARIEYLLRCGATMSNEKVGPILAALHCDYRKQIKFPDTLIISASVTKVGNSSVNIKHYLWSQSRNELAAEGESIIVMFDYEQQQTVRVSDNMRQKIAEIEAGMK